MTLLKKDQGGDQEGDGWIVSEGICRHCGSPRRMSRREHSGNQEFGPLTPPSGKRQKEEEDVTDVRDGDSPSHRGDEKCSLIIL